MEELKVVGNLIKLDCVKVNMIDATIGNRSFEDTSSELKDMDISENKIQEIDFYSHLDADNSINGDIIGYYENNSIGIEAKGLAPSKTNKSNFKYWAKGIVDQVLEIDDTEELDLVGIAIPKNCKNTLRGILSSFHKEIDDDMVKSYDPEDLYGERKYQKLDLFNDDDLIFIVSDNNVETMSCRDFFGL